MSNDTPAADAFEEGTERSTLLVESVTRQDLVKYAGASGDFNPIHYDEGAAKEAGHPGVIAQGMFTAGVLEQLVTNWVGVGNVRSFSVRFTSIVQPGDSIHGIGEVESVETDGDDLLLSLSVRAENQDGDPVVRGSASARVPR